MVDAPGFPTQGELIRFAFRVAGVLPEKHDPILPRGSTRDSIRKAISRLAQEEGKLEENFGELLQQLGWMVAGYTVWPPVHMLIGDVVNDLIDDYRDLLTNEGTYLDRRQTLRWIIRDRWVACTVITLARNAGKWKPSMLLPFRPADKDWFLPDFTEKGVIWPMRKALEWVYQIAGLSQTQFHYPGRDAAESDVEKQHQLENAQNWVSGRSLPSAATLQASIRSAVNNRSRPIASLSDPRRLQCAETVLYLARVSTAIWQAVVDAHGEDFAKDMRTLFAQLWELMQSEMSSVERELGTVTRKTGISRANPDLRSEILAHWGSGMAIRSKAVCEKLCAIAAAGHIPTEEQYQQLIHDYGAVPVETNAISLRLGRMHELPKSFLDAFGEWQWLRSSRDTGYADVEVFEEHLSAYRLAEVLCWMPAWLRFQQAYRSEDYPAAWVYITQAYELAKYRAGKAQYEIVNQYVEMAAKCGTLQEFRRGISWARYIGLKVRWIRDRPLTPENLKLAKFVFQHAKYEV